MLRSKVEVAVENIGNGGGVKPEIFGDTVQYPHRKCSESPYAGRLRTVP